MFLQGSEYQPSTTECCGRCVATHCVMENGDLLAPGERKTDETGCKTTECKLISGKPSTIVESAVCPEIPSDCPPQFLVPDKTGCCQVCSRPEKLSKFLISFCWYLKKLSFFRKLCCHPWRGGHSGQGGALPTWTWPLQELSSYFGLDSVSRAVQVWIIFQLRWDFRQIFKKSWV